MTWRPAHSLTVLRSELWSGYPRAAPPATLIVSWGMYASPNSGETSDHQPKNFPGWGNEIVTAHDFPHRPDLGLDAGHVCEALRASRDPRIKYVIYNRRIFSYYATATRGAWQWGPYSNAATQPHTDHAHVSVVGDARADGTQSWSIGVSTMAQWDLTLDPNFSALIGRVDAVRRNAANYSGWQGQPEVNELAKALARLEESLTSLHAKVDALSTGAGHSIQDIEDAAYRAHQRAEDS